MTVDYDTLCQDKHVLITKSAQRISVLHCRLTESLGARDPTTHQPVEMETLLGISKATFIDSHVIPANDNDRFNDNKCAFCWDTYSDSHVPVRTLPCNHVFGRNCLLEALDANNGDLCIICRTPLFRASVPELLSRSAVSALRRFVAWSTAWYYKCLAFYTTLPRWIQHPLRWVWCWRDRDLVFWFLRMLEYYTGLGARNPHLNLGLLLSSAPAIKLVPQLPIVLLRLGRSLEEASTRAPVTRVDTLVAGICALQLVVSAILTSVIWDGGVRGKVERWWDRMLVATMIFLALAATHAFDLLAIGCYLANRNPVDFYGGGTLVLFENNARLGRTFKSDSVVEQLHQQQDAWNFIMKQ